jgi:ribonuclease J
VVLAEDGVVVDLVDGKASVVGAVPCGYVYVDGSSVGEITEAELKDRVILGEEGFVSVFAVIDTATGKVLAPPQVLARGMAEDASVFDKVMPEVTAALENAIAGGATDTHQLQQIMRRTIGRYVATRLRRKPMIVPVVVEA